MLTRAAHALRQVDHLPLSALASSTEPYTGKALFLNGTRSDQFDAATDTKVGATNAASPCAATTRVDVVHTHTARWPAHVPCTRRLAWCTLGPVRPRLRSTTHHAWRCAATGFMRRLDDARAVESQAFVYTSPRANVTSAFLVFD